MSTPKTQDNSKQPSTDESTQPARTNEDKEYANTVADSSGVQAELGRPDAEFSIYGLTKKPKGEENLTEPEIRGIEPAPKRPAK